MATTLPGHKIAMLYATLDAACKHKALASDDDMWVRLNEARSFVKIYLLESIPPVAVEIDTREAA
jgi:hypothetical protein